MQDKHGKRINKELLKEFIKSSAQYYYICGPDEFVAELKSALIELGVVNKKIVIEE